MVALTTQKPDTKHQGQVTSAELRHPAIHKITESIFCVLVIVSIRPSELKDRVPEEGAE